MEQVERLVRTWIASPRDEEIQKTVSAILEGSASLLDVVKALGEYLTSEEDELRTKGVEFLSAVIEKYPADKMNRQAVRVLVSFMRSKLDDTETIVPALKGIPSLITQQAFSSSDAIEVVKALFAHVKMRALVQSQRFLVFKSIDSLVARHREALKGMGKEFLTGYLALADGEKDPRNLLLAFAIARVILIEFDIHGFIEDLFNITFCYFPITFRPPPDDPYGITADDLKTRLRECLNATPLFGSLAVPLFLEKLTAGSPTTKRDTLQTLDICLPVYGAAIARENAKKLWSMLKLEIFQPTDVETEAMALKTTQVLIQTIYSSFEEGEKVEGLAKDICEECIKILKEPEKSQAKPAIKVVSAFVSTTPSVSQFALSQAVPHLVKLFLDPDEAQNRAPTLRLLADLVIAARDSTLKGSQSPTGSQEPSLAPYKDDILGVFTVGVKVKLSCKNSLDGLKGMVTTLGLLTDEELGFVVHNVNEVLDSEEVEDDDVSEAILELLTSVSQVSPRHVSETTLPRLFSSLPDRPSPRAAEAERIRQWRTLAFLKRLCVQSELFETLVVRLSTKLDLICVPSTASEGEEDVYELSAAYAHSILRTLEDGFAKKVELGHTDVVKYIDRLVPRLFNLHIYSVLVSDGVYMVAKDPRLVSVSAEITTLILQSVSLQRQEGFVTALFDTFLHASTSGLAEGQHKLPEGKKFDPFGAEASSIQKNVVLLFTAALVAVHKEAKYPVPDESAFLKQLLHWSIHQTESSLQRDAGYHAIASILNKRADELSGFFSDRLDIFWSTEASNAAVSTDLRRNAISAWTWITKALVVRGHSLGQHCTNRLFDLFDDVDVSWDAARAIGKIVAADNILTKKNHAVIKFLYAQRFSTSILPKLIEGAKSSENMAKQNAYLVALTSLIKSIPKSIYAHQLPTLMPLLLRGLDLPDHEIRANVINTLLAVADPTRKDKDNGISEHATSLVSTMLKNTQAKDIPSVRVRIAALKYLAILPKLVRYDVLHPQKAKVVRELAKALDDPKRAVRVEAVEARTNWFKFSG